MTRMLGCSTAEAVSTPESATARSSVSAARQAWFRNVKVIPQPDANPTERSSAQNRGIPLAHARSYDEFRGCTQLVATSVSEWTSFGSIQHQIRPLHVLQRPFAYGEPFRRTRAHRHAGQIEFELPNARATAAINEDRQFFRHFLLRLVDLEIHHA